MVGLQWPLQNVSLEEKEMIIKTDRKEIDQAIKGLRLFTEAPKAIANYKAEIANIEVEEEFLREELVKFRKGTCG